MTHLRPQRGKKSLLRGLIFLLSTQAAIQTGSPPLYAIADGYTGGTFNFNCDTTHSTHFIAARIVQHSGKPISIKIQTPTIPAENQFMTDTDGNKRYGYYQTGTNCYFHTDLSGKNSNPMFIILIRNNGDGGPGGNNCQIVGVVTNIGLQPCGATEVDSLEIQPLALVADNSETPSLSSFSKIAIHRD